MYAEHFDLKAHIKFHRRVTAVTPILNANGEHTGAWEVTVEKMNGKKKELKRTGESSRLVTSSQDAAAGETSTASASSKNSSIKTYTFDSVMVATGHHWKPKLPDYPGVELFQGKMLHSHSYRVPYPFKDQRVLIVGVGNSGLDIATELSTHAKQVFISSRSGTWILPKFSLFGLPTDHLSSRAAFALPRSMLNFALESLSKMYAGDLDKFGLKPSHHALEASPTVNGDVLDRIASGKIIVKPNVAQFLDADTVQFTDDTDEEIDVIVYCTGYSIENHFLESSSILGQEELETGGGHDGNKETNNRVKLYKHIFPLRHSNMAWIGLVQPLGSVLPVAEMQARWAARVLSGKLSLPNSRDMIKESEEDWVHHCATYIPRPRHTVQVDYIPYMDMMAHKVGCAPDLTLLWLRDWVLAAQVTFGPAVPPQYRLSGPGAWDGAREAIATACRGHDFRSLRRRSST